MSHQSPSDSSAAVSTLAELVAEQARRRPTAVALTADEGELSFDALNRRASQVAQSLRRANIGVGARVGTLARDCLATFECLFGVAKVGAVSLGLNWRLAEDELAYIVDDARVELLFVGADFAQVAQVLRERCSTLATIVVIAAGAEDQLATTAARGATDVTHDYAEWRDASSPRETGRLPHARDCAVQMYTSGTTGLPKGVMLPHESFFAVVRALREAGDPWIEWSETDVALHNIPAFHIGGLWWAITALSHGARLVVLDAFVGWKVLEAIERERVSKVCMVPSMIQVVLSEPRAADADLDSLTHLVYGGSPIPRPLLERTLERFDCEPVQIYGLTETGNTAVCLRGSEHGAADSPRALAAGKPYPSVRLKIIDRDGRELPAGEVGEICIHSPANMLGYWNRPEANAETLRDGWVHTGDAGYLDADGFVYVHDRLKDMIIYAGENVYPAEIESVLCAHPGVAEAAVIGVPDERWGEAIMALVVPRGESPSAAELAAHCRPRIADFKVPRSFECVDALPRTPSGKIKKSELREPFWRGRERPVN